MLIIGLTGSIGMGKSETARLFQSFDVPVYDADATVHRLYDRGGAAVLPIGALFPDVIQDGAVDRVRLAAHVVGKPEALRRLEAIVHPLTRKEQDAWLTARAKEGAAIVVLDIPLLLEGGGKDHVDVVVVVSAPPDMQRARVMARPGMTVEKLEAVLARQMPDSEKRAHADFVVDTGQGIPHACEQVKDIVQALAKRPGQAWEKRRKS